MAGDCLLVRPSAGRSLSRFTATVDGLILESTRDEFTPEGVPEMDGRAKGLLDAALDLGSDDEWTDAVGVAELVRRADLHRDALRVAEINSRNGRTYLDLEIENRAQRLLEAAVSGEPVKPVSAEDRQRFEVIWALAELPVEEKWDTLVRAVPALRTLVDGIRSATGHGQLSKEELDRVMETVASLVGPRSGTSDMLLGSVYVRTLALNYVFWQARHGQRG
jgi:hypothetical protein